MTRAEGTMSGKARVLLVTRDGAGNLPPERSIARAPVAPGHPVEPLARESVRANERGGTLS